MAEQFLHSADVRAGFEHVGGEAVAEGVAGGGLLDAGGAQCFLDPSLQRVVVHMMTPPGAGAWIA
jgi:hypothetical protein